MSVKVIVADLVGRSLPLELPATETVKAIKEAVATSWGLDPCTFHLLMETKRMDEASKLESFLTEKMEAIEVQLLKFDPLLDLGQFDIGNHEGVEFSGEHQEVLKKTKGYPDSNNVFLRRGIQEPCFVEFEVRRCRDEMSFGVTYDRHVEKLSSSSNLSATTTWIFSKKQELPVFLLGGSHVNPPGMVGLQEKDIVGVYADPEARLVEFYCNGQLVGSTLSLGVPLPPAVGRPLWMYAMVDQVHDHIRIARFGPGRP
ncbi:unnamed protein product [Effrenium voratum]|nr:unnamed protein product [Effrenium voratum]